MLAPARPLANAPQATAGRCEPARTRGAGENPSAYLEVIASVIPREIKIEPNPLEDMSDQELEAIEALRKGIIAEDEARDKQSLQPASVLAH